MDQQKLLLFLKYPYSAAVLIFIWAGSTVMMFQDRSMPVMTIVVINLLVSWIIVWLSFRPTKTK